MKLTVLSNYGSKEKVISENATADQIIETMLSIDWKVFHQVILGKDNDDWLEVGGNLKSDGLSVTYEEMGQQYFIVKPPVSVDQMTKILLSYHAGDGIFKQENKFE